MDALPLRMTQAGTLRRRTTNNEPALSPYKITIVGSNDGSEAELVRVFVNGGSTEGGEVAEVDLYLSSWKKKFNHAGNEYLLELHAGLQAQAETALNVNKSENIHVHDQFESTAGFMFVYDVTRRESFAEVMRVHSHVVRSKRVDKGKARGLIPMIVLANTRHKGSTASSSAPQREVSTEEGLEFAYSCNCPFYEITSSNYDDVLNAFQQLLGEILKRKPNSGTHAAVSTSTSTTAQQKHWRRSQSGADPQLSLSEGAVVAPSDVASRDRIQKPIASSTSSLPSPRAEGAKEELHESLKDRQRGFRYTRVDTEEIKYLPPLDGEPNSKPRIRAATLPKLIEKLTYPKYPDTDLVATFLLTYRSFTTPEELLHFLVMRYDITAPSDLDKEGLRLWEANEMLPVRLRVINVLKGWISDHFYDFYDSKTLLDGLKEFIERQLALPTNLKGPLQQLKKSIEINELERRARKEYMFSSKPPKSVISKKVAKARPQEIDLRDIDPLEMARQLTLIDYDLLSRVTAKEWLAHNEWTVSRARNKDDESKPAAPNLVAMINHFNRVSRWVATEIVKCNKIKHRVLLTKKFIEVAQHCLKLNNFNMLMAIVTGGLGNVSVYRLKYSWKSLPKKTLMGYEELRTLCDSLSNFNSLRTAIRTSVPPTIPYLGLYLSDLMYIEDGNADEVEGGLINFEKRRLKAEIIKDLQHFQTSPYCLTEVPVLQYYFRGLEFLNDAELYRMSCILEPHSRQRGASYANAPARGVADQLSGITELLDSPDSDVAGPPSTIGSSSSTAARRISSDDNLTVGKDSEAAAAALLSTSPGSPGSGIMSYFDLRSSTSNAGTTAAAAKTPSSPHQASSKPAGREHRRPPRGGAVLRAQARTLEAVASTFSFADAARATAAVEILQRWEAQVAARKLFVVRDHTDSLANFGVDNNNDDNDDGADPQLPIIMVDNGSPSLSPLSSFSSSLLSTSTSMISTSTSPSPELAGPLASANSSIVGDEQRKRSGSKRKERAAKVDKTATPTPAGKSKPQAAAAGVASSDAHRWHHRTFSFEELLMESRAVEIALERFLVTATVDGLLAEAARAADGAGWLAGFEAFLHRRLLGGQRPALVSELLFALVKLLDKGPACFHAAAVAGMVGLYKKQPIPLAVHFLLDEAETELSDRHDRLVELEEREGGRTIQSYTKEVRLAYQILNVEKRILQAVKVARPDGSMQYEVLTFDREAWQRSIQEVLSHTHSPREAAAVGGGEALAAGGTPRRPLSSRGAGGNGETTHKIMGELIQLVDKHLGEVTQDDLLRFNESFEAALEEHFEWMGLYLRKLWDKLVLIHKRMEKLLRTKDASSEATSKAVNAWREKDLVHLQALIAAVDQAETIANRFLESCPTFSSTDGFEVTEEELKQLLSQNHVFEQIIKMRRLQKTLEEQNARLLDM